MVIPMIVWYIIVAIIGEALKPKPTYAQNAKASRGPVNMPVVSSTKPIPVIVGKVRLRDPSIIWYGDFKADPLTENGGRGGMFGLGATHWITTGYKYFFGQHLALCHGRGVVLHKIWSDETVLYGEPKPGDPIEPPIDGSVDGGTFSIDKDNFYGGEAAGGAGGLSAKCVLSVGANPVPDPYLVLMLGVVPSYKGVATFIWKGPSDPNKFEWDTTYSYQTPGATRDDPPVTVVATLHHVKSGGYIGTMPTPHPLSFELSRYPWCIPGSPQGESIVASNPDLPAVDANPVEFLYECLTTDPNGADGWGMGLDASLIDTPSFLAAAHMCYVKHMGISAIWDQQQPIEDLVTEVSQTIDAVCYRDFRSGKYKIKMICDDYDVATLPELNTHNVVELESYIQGCVDGTTNEVKVNFQDRANDYQNAPAQAQNMANMRAQGEVISATTSYDCVCDAHLANRLAMRDLKAASAAIAACEVVVNRTMYSYGPGDVFKLNWAPLGIENMIMRCIKVSIGLPTANQIRMSLIQDVFAIGQTAYTLGGGGGTSINPTPAPAQITTEKLFELPWFFGSEPNLMVCAQRPNAGATGYEIWKNANPREHLTDADFTPMATLAAPYTSKHTVDAGTMIVNGSGDLDINSLRSASSGEISGSHANIAVIEGPSFDEYIAFETVTDNHDGTYTLSGIWGGLFDTLPSAHAAGARVWFFTYGFGRPDVGATPYGVADIRCLSKSAEGTVDIAGALPAVLPFHNRAGKMLPPGGLKVNGTLDTISTTPITGEIVLAWAHRNRGSISQTTVIKQDADGNATAEGSYILKIYSAGTLRHTITGWTANTYTYTKAQRLDNGLVAPFACRVEVTQASADGAPDSSRTHTIEFTCTILSVVSKTTMAEPAAASGTAWIVPVGATGTHWAGQDKKVAYYSTAGGWVFYAPSAGWEVAVDGGGNTIYSGTAWS